MYPDKSLFDEWIYRMKNRGNNDKFISFIASNWDKFIDDIEAETFPTKVKLVSEVNMDAITCTLMNRIISHKEYIS